jgi:excisionase family DNA binding protein
MELITMTEKLLPLETVSEYLLVTVDYVRRIIRRGELRGAKIGHRWLVTETALRQYIAQKEAWNDTDYIDPEHLNDFIDDEDPFASTTSVYLGRGGTA